MADTNNAMFTVLAAATILGGTVDLELADEDTSSLELDKEELYD